MSLSGLSGVSKIISVTLNEGGGSTSSNTASFAREYNEGDAVKGFILPVAFLLASWFVLQRKRGAV